MPDKVIPVVVGVDIGGTNTDAVLIHRQSEVPQVLAAVKELTTSDVITGVKKAVLRCLLEATSQDKSVSPIQVNIGTTHFVNAVVQKKDLAKVAVVRICGPVSEELPPFCDFPTELADVIRGPVYLIHGGYRFDGQEREKLDTEQLKNVLREIQKDGITNIAYVGIFSPVRSDQEIRAREITKEVYPKATVSLSHEIGHIGLLERENATILNESLKPLCKKTVSGFQKALSEIGICCPFYLTQNDGTIISSKDVLEQPVLTFASGPTNSMRGAAFLSELTDAIVVDIGGTTTDVGILKNGFPREASTHVKVAGVRTNFRMPDVVSIGLGGGSYIKQYNGKSGALEKVTVGPLSAGLNLVQEAFVFSDGHDLDDRQLTATDVAVASGLCHLGSSERVKDLNSELVMKAVDKIHLMLEDIIDKIKLSKEELPVIIVGGGSVLIDRTRKLYGTTKIIVPQHFGVANAIGAALSKVAAVINTVVNLLKTVDVAEMDRRVQEAVRSVTDDPDGKKKDLAINEARKPFLIKARDEAIEKVCSRVKDMAVRQGADTNSLEILEKQDSVVAYVPGSAVQIKVKVVGDLVGWESKLESLSPWSSLPHCNSIFEQQNLVLTKQTFSSTGQRIDKYSDIDFDKDYRQRPQNPFVDPVTGEWILSEWDIECIVVGSGIYGTGGGGNPQMGRIRALKAIGEGKKIRVITPERLLQDVDPDKSIVIVSAFIGAPLIMYEQGVSSKETTVALQCLKDAYEVGGFHEASLRNTDGATVETNEAGCQFVKNYQPKDQATSGNEIIALMSAEIGGLNAIEPFLIAANLDLPVVDGDGMSRAFPEVQMFIPYMFDKPPYPAAIVGSGNCDIRTTLLYAPNGKLLENFLRDVSIENGCSAGLAIPLKKDEVLNKTALHTVSSAWRLGDAILRARLQKESVIEAIIRQEDGRHIITGKVTDVARETSGGFNRGYLILEGVDDWLGQDLRIDFQNENLVIILFKNGSRVGCLGSVPDLICVVDSDTAEPITTEEVRYGMRVAVLLLPSHDLLRRPESLRWVGPHAFHYDDIEFKPFKHRTTKTPIPYL
ncbi:unnamed protein product [Candidula unifasciata]|uniref:Hydantoinase n=1 Tax=Candidula unifasciata TaxID=100452 RepID=A0A8S4A1G7_9EUPU|nr:unnamed protein product [Candidula unifasciata]